MNRREFITHTGKYKGKKISVISTGIGTDNVEIFFTELDALANIDLKKREVRPKKKRLKIVRIGTSGALQEDIAPGTHLVSDYCIGLDGLLAFYEYRQDPAEQKILDILVKKVKLPFKPYMARGSQALQTKVAFDMVVGNTVTTPGFYGPQGRSLRAKIKFPKLLDELNYFHYGDFWLTNFEMESAGYYAFGILLGHDVLSVNAILANRISNKFASNPDKVIDDLILKVLNRI